MKKLTLIALLAALCFGLTSCEKEILCLYEVSCVDTSYDATWKDLGRGYSGIRDALVNVGFLEESTDMFSKKGTPTKTKKLIKETVENEVANNDNIYLKGIEIKVVFYNDENRPVITKATYKGRPE